MTDDEIIYAGFWRRVAANLIDAGILLIPSMAAYAILTFTSVPIRTLQFVGNLTFVFYFVLFQISHRQATIGQSIMGIYVATVDNKGMTFWRALMRLFLWIMPLIPLTALSMSSDYINIVENLRKLEAEGNRQAIDALMKDPDTSAILAGKALLSAVCLFLFALWCIPAMVFTKQKAGLHDLLTRTRVFKRQTNN